MAAEATTERKRRSRRFKGLVAGVTGLALLMGGSTFAMWSESANSNVGQVQHGTLEVLPGEMHIYDLTTPGDKKSFNQEGVTEIDLDTYRATPGDKIEVDMVVDVNAPGDNMKYFVSLGSSVPVIEDKWTAVVDAWNSAGARVNWNAAEPTKPTTLGLTQPGISSPGPGIIMSQRASNTFRLAVTFELPKDSLTGWERQEGEPGDSLPWGDFVVTATQQTSI
ncbi:MAG: hypothetical protein LBK95_08955 [Bifidobacteriaceae bacterium]|jgi:alternate signal-mediated exported protein|nr:hypothetical protein [Bifidobacteriaceae bacterium]